MENFDYLRVKREATSLKRPTWKMLLLLLGSALIFLFVLSGIVWFGQQKLGLGSTPLPDFGSVENTNERKAAFFEYILPLVEASNKQLLSERARLEAVHAGQVAGARISASDRRWVTDLLQEYGLEAPSEEITEATLDLLLEHVDIVPASLALAQAALESGWGASRFAREGNNLFGMWCYRPGCGLVPKNRPKGATHEVARYRTPQGSIEAYIQNLNTNTAYASMREVRRSYREAGQPPTGEALAAGLLLYSQERQGYVEKVRAMIRSNNLDRFDRSNASG